MVIKTMCATAFLWCVLTHAVVLAGGFKEAIWVSGMIGPTKVNVPIIDGLSIRTMNPDLELHILAGIPKKAAETADRLRAIAEADAGLKIRSMSLLMRSPCRSSVELPICKYGPSSKGAATVSWLQIIHRPDMSFAHRNLELRRSREVLTLRQGSASFSVSLLESTRRHPYGCPADKEFGQCYMYMQVEDDVLAVMMFWRQGDVSSSTPSNKWQTPWE